MRLGYAFEAMIDLTGAPYRCIRLDFINSPEGNDADKSSGAMSARDTLWSDLLNYDKLGYLMAVSTPGEDVYTESGQRPEKHESGLVAGHAYSLLTVKETKEGFKLVQLRNPWGNLEVR